ncbi:hypothetical protein MNV49_002439 [Pseudohyphozyma bogoriensis]|nr:hypothetical protein MNV49_002439 [Pseudohyphozyma bogoriensis]
MENIMTTNADHDEGLSGLEFKPGVAASVALVLATIGSLAVDVSLVRSLLFIQVVVDGESRIMLTVTAVLWLIMGVTSMVTFWAIRLPPEESAVWTRVDGMVWFLISIWTLVFGSSVYISFNVYNVVMNCSSGSCPKEDNELCIEGYILLLLALIASLAMVILVALDLKNHHAQVLQREYLLSHELPTSSEDEHSDAPTYPVEGKVSLKLNATLTVREARRPPAQSLAPLNPPWSGGTAPYYVSVIPGGEASATAYETFPTTNDTSYTWTVDIGAGTAISLQVKDSTGTIAYSDEDTIQSGSDTSCVTTTG